MNIGKPIPDANSRQLAEEGLEELEAERKLEAELMHTEPQSRMVYASIAACSDGEDDVLPPAAAAYA